MHFVQHGGAYNRVADPSFGVLYLNATIDVAVGNVRLGYENEILSVYDLVPEQRPDLQHVTVKKAAFVNAETVAGLRALRLPATYPLGSSYALSRLIGTAAYTAGRNGIACRTADATARTAAIVDGEELAVFDIVLTLVKAVKRVKFADWYPLPGPLANRS